MERLPREGEIHKHGKWIYFVLYNGIYYLNSFTDDWYAELSVEDFMSLVERIN